jgi:hypothetical protein
MTPSSGTQLLRIVVTGTTPYRINCWELIPLLACDLTSFTTNTEAGVGEEAQRWLGWQRWALL